MVEALIGGLLGGLIAAAAAVAAVAVALVSRQRRRELGVPAPRAAQIEGRWAGRWTAESETTDGQPAAGTDELVLVSADRRGQRFTGTLRCLTGWRRTASYDVRASYADGILTALIEDQDETTVARGTLTLQLLAYGERLVGHAVISGGSGSADEILRYEAERLRREPLGTVRVPLDQSSAPKKRDEKPAEKKAEKPKPAVDPGDPNGPRVIDRAAWSTATAES
ncbi:MAG: hypothetical protein AAGI17_06770 [Planctomycetota bacterium]